MDQEDVSAGAVDHDVAIYAVAVGQRDDLDGLAEWAAHQPMDID